MLTYKGRSAILRKMVSAGLIVFFCNCSKPFEDPYSTVTVSPSEIKNLPEKIKEYLTAGEIRIPQPFFYDQTEKYNAIQGKFVDNTRVSWAILGLKDQTVVLYVFSDSNFEKVHRIESFSLQSCFQEIEEGKKGFSYILERASKEEMLKRQTEKGKPVFTHEGISLVFAEKGSIIYYYENEKWSELPGSD